MRSMNPQREAPTLAVRANRSRPGISTRSSRHAETCPVVALALRLLDAETVEHQHMRGGGRGGEVLWHCLNGVEMRVNTWKQVLGPYW